MVFERATVLGVGLIGASLAMALKRQGLSGHITGYGRTEANLIKAKELSIIDSYELDPVRACKGADVVVFATPVGRFSELADKIKGSIKKDAIVIDVGSVKGGLVYEMERIFGNRFVGCHPIAGSERSGIGAATAELFSGALCIVTKTEAADATTLDKIIRLWEALGSRVEVMSPEEHDKIYGLVSHLPHVAAYAMVNTVADIDNGYLKYAGKGFKDTTRIASSSPEVWRDICLMNRENIIGFIDIFMKNLEGLRHSLRNGDSKALEEAFGKARDLRLSIKENNKK